MDATLTIKPVVHTLARVLLGGMAVLATLGTPTPVCAQRPFQGAGKDSGSIFIGSGGFAQFNIATGSLRLGYLHEVNPNEWSIGFDVSGKLAGAKAGIFSQNQIVPDAQINVSIGWKYLLTDRLKKPAKEGTPALSDQKPTAEGKQTGVRESEDKGKSFSGPVFDRLSFQFGYGYKQYNLLDPVASFDKQLSKQNFHSPSGSINYFILLDGHNIVGATFGAERSNNSNSLTEVEVRDIVNTGDANTVREVSRIRKALRGAYKESTRTFFNTDYVWFPAQLGSRIGINLYTRSGLSGDEKGVRPGVGVFISEPGKPTRVIGGLSVSYENGKANFGLVAGFNF